MQKQSMSFIKGIKRGGAPLRNSLPSPLMKGLALNVILRNEVTKNLWVGLVVHR